MGTQSTWTTIAKFDQMMRENLNTIVGTVLSNTSYAQACLPVSLSGMGIKRATDHKLCCFIASVIASLPHIFGLIGHGEVISGDGDSDNELGTAVRLASRLISPAALAE